MSSLRRANICGTLALSSGRRMDITFDRFLAVAGIVVGIIVVVLDKAEKLKGPTLLVLLGVAALMTLPFALGNSWVKDPGTGGMLRFSKSVLMLSLVAVCYSIFACWISSSPKQEIKEQAIEDKSKQKPDLRLSVGMLNGGQKDPPEATTAFIRIIARVFNSGSLPTIARDWNLTITCKGESRHATIKYFEQNAVIVMRSRNEPQFPPSKY